jgi:ribosome-associated protein
VADLEITRSWTVPAAELVERFSRSSGPGGQSVNTTDSRVELSVDLAGSPSMPAYLQERVLERLGSRLTGGVLTVAASEHRTQHANRRAARDRLGDLLREAAAPPPPPRRATRPSRRARERRLTDNKRRGETKRGRQGRFD